MNKYLLKTTGLAALICSLHSPASAQDDRLQTDSVLAPAIAPGTKSRSEIVIVQNGDKDAKISIEIKDGKVFINGKPSAEYKDGSVIIRSRRLDGGDMAQSFNIQELGDDDFVAPPPPASPFRKRSGATSMPRMSWSTAPHAFLGVTSEDAGEGAKITAISKGSTADKIGLKIGDIITRVDEIKIDGPSSLSEAIRKYKPEDKVNITYKRNGKEQKQNVILGKSAPANTMTYNFSMPEMDDMNLDMAPRIYGDGNAYGRGAFGPKVKLGIKAQDTEDGKGVKVLSVGDESPAEKAGIHEGDILTTLNGKTIENAAALSQMARAATTESNAPPVKIGLLRDGKPLEIEVRIPKKLKTADL